MPACLSRTTRASCAELRLTYELLMMCVFGNAGCVSRMSLRSYADGSEEEDEEADAFEGCSEAEGCAQDEAEVGRGFSIEFGAAA